MKFDRRGHEFFRVKAQGATRAVEPHMSEIGVCCRWHPEPPRVCRRSRVASPRSARSTIKIRTSFMSSSSCSCFVNRGTDQICFGELGSIEHQKALGKENYPVHLLSALPLLALRSQYLAQKTMARMDRPAGRIRSGSGQPDTCGFETDVVVLRSAGFGFAADLG